MSRNELGAIVCGIGSVACAAAGESPAWLLFLAGSVLFYLASLVEGWPR